MFPVFMTATPAIDVNMRALYFRQGMNVNTCTQNNAYPFIFNKLQSEHSRSLSFEGARGHNPVHTNSRITPPHGAKHRDTPRSATRPHPPRTDGRRTGTR